MKKKSNKLRKLENNRFSLFDDPNKCHYCKSNYNLTWHEIYSGRNRQNSMKYGLCLRLCINCHRLLQENNELYDLEFDVVSRKNGLNQYRVQRLQEIKTDNSVENNVNNIVTSTLELPVSYKDNTTKLPKNQVALPINNSMQQNQNNT